MNDKKDDPSEIFCPVCGYYCLGNGGFGCIDKPSLVERNKELKTVECRSVDHG